MSQGSCSGASSMTTEILRRHAVASGWESTAFLSQVVNSRMLRSCLGVGVRVRVRLRLRLKEGGGESGRVEEGERHVHRVHVVRVLEAREPLAVSSVEHELGGEGYRVEGGAAGRPCGDEDAHLSVGVGEEEGVGDALQHRGGLVALVSDVQVRMIHRVEAHLVGVIDGVEAHRALHPQRLKGELEPRQGYDAQLRL
eukprot:scaffold63294_cov33-Phaeocystis_antarctica.AAC.1